MAGSAREGALRPAMTTESVSSAANEKPGLAAGLCAKKRTAGFPPPFVEPDLSAGLAEETQHRLVGLRGERQGRRGQLLAGLQGQEVRTFLVGVGQHEVVRAG